MLLTQPQSHSYIGPRIQNSIQGACNPLSLSSHKSYLPQPKAHTPTNWLCLKIHQLQTLKAYTQQPVALQTPQTPPLPPHLNIKKATKPTQ